MFWHWEAMLISYLATRVTVLPFYTLTGLLKTSDFRIALNPGSSYEDAFKLSKDPTWQEAWINRIQPYLDDYRNESSRMINFPLKEAKTALYDNYFSARYTQMRF